MRWILCSGPVWECTSICRCWSNEVQWQLGCLRAVSQVRCISPQFSETFVSFRSTVVTVVDLRWVNVRWWRPFGVAAIRLKARWHALLRLRVSEIIHHHMSCSVIFEVHCQRSNSYTQRYSTGSVIFEVHCQSSNSYNTEVFQSRLRPSLSGRGHGRGRVLGSPGGLGRAGDAWCRRGVATTELCIWWIDMNRYGMIWIVMVPPKAKGCGNNY